MTSDQFIIYAGIFIGALILYYIMTQWVHQIHKRNRYLKAQMDLLSKIALTQGVSKDEVETIINVANRPDSIL